VKLSFICLFDDNIFLTVAWYIDDCVFHIICHVAQKGSLFWGGLEPAFCRRILDRNTIIYLILSNYNHF